MADVGLVAAGRHMAVHPRDHVAAVAAARGENPLRVGPGLLEQQVGRALDVLQLELAPAAGDRVGEAIAEARRAVVVHAGHHVARRRHRLVVPAPVPAVAHRGVRAAVDQVHQRRLGLAARVESGRVVEPHLHRLAERALVPALLDRAEGQRRQRRVVEGLDPVQHLFLGIAFPVDDGQPRREARAVMQDDQRAGLQREGADMAALAQREGVQRLDVEAVEVAAAALLGAEEHAQVVLVPAQRRGDLLVPVLGQHRPVAMGVQHRQLLRHRVLQALVTGDERDVVPRMAVHRRDQVPGRLMQQHLDPAGAHLDLGQRVAVLQRLGGVGVEAEDDAAAVGRDVEAVGIGLGAAQFVVGAFEEVAHLAAVEVDDMQVRHAAHRQRMVPEAVEAFLGDVGRVLAILLGLVALNLRGLALERGIDPGHEGHAPAVREPLEGLDAEGHLRHAARLAAVGRDHVQLRGLVLVALLVAARDEGHEVALRAPARLAVLLAGGGQRARIATQRGQQPQRGRALVLLHVEARHRHHGLGAVRRQAGRAQSRQRPQRIDVQALERRRRAGALRGRPFGRLGGLALGRVSLGGVLLGGVFPGRGHQALRGLSSCHCRWLRTVGHSAAVML